MVELGRGGIVNISSLAAFVPGEGPYERVGTPTGFAYGGNKAAMHHLTEAVAFEMAPHNIAVNALLPSEPVLTPGNLVAYQGGDDWASADDFAEADAARRLRPERDNRTDPLERGRAASRAGHPRAAPPLAVIGR